MELYPNITSPFIRRGVVPECGRLLDLGPRGYRDPWQRIVPLGGGPTTLLSPYQEQTTNLGEGPPPAPASLPSFSLDVPDFDMPSVNMWDGISVEWPSLPAVQPVTLNVTVPGQYMGEPPLMPPGQRLGPQIPGRNIGGGFFFGPSGGATHTLGGDSHTDVQSLGGAEGEILYFNSTLGHYTSLPPGANGTVLNVSGGTIVYGKVDHGLFDTTWHDNIEPTPTTGDLFYYDGSDLIGLDIGNPGQHLIVSGGNLPAWDDDSLDSHNLDAAEHLDVAAMANVEDDFLVYTSGNEWDRKTPANVRTILGIADGAAITLDSLIRVTQSGNYTLSTGIDWRGRMVRASLAWYDGTLANANANPWEDGAVVGGKNGASSTTAILIGSWAAGDIDLSIGASGDSGELLLDVILQVEAEMQVRIWVEATVDKSSIDETLPVP